MSKLNPLDMAANLAVSGLSSLSNVTVAMAGAAGGVLSSGAKSMMSGAFARLPRARARAAQAACYAPGSRALPGAPSPPPGEGAFFDETVTPEKIKKLLDNMEVTGKGAIIEKVEGMKYILAVRGGGQGVRAGGRGRHEERGRAARRAARPPLTPPSPRPPSLSKWRAAATRRTFTPTSCAT